MIGIELIVSPLTTTSRRVDCVSTSGAAPLTVTVSETAPMRISMLIGTTPEPETATPSRLTVLNPLSEKVRM